MRLVIFGILDWAATIWCASSNEALIMVQCVYWLVFWVTPHITLLGLTATTLDTTACLSVYWAMQKVLQNLCMVLNRHHIINRQGSQVKRWNFFFFLRDLLNTVKNTFLEKWENSKGLLTDQLHKHARQAPAESAVSVSNLLKDFLTNVQKSTCAYTFIT